MRKTDYCVIPPSPLVNLHSGAVEDGGQTAATMHSGPDDGDACSALIVESFFDDRHVVEGDM